MSETKTKSNNVNHPKHYNPGKYEAIKIIEHYDLNFRLGNTVKYILRSDKKHETLEKQLEDLEKALWYLKRDIRKKKKQLQETKQFLCLQQSTDKNNQTYCYLPREHQCDHAGIVLNHDDQMNSKIFEWPNVLENKVDKDIVYSSPGDGEIDLRQYDQDIDWLSKEKGKLSLLFRNIFITEQEATLHPYPDCDEKEEK